MLQYSDHSEESHCTEQFLLAKWLVRTFWLFWLDLCYYAGVCDRRHAHGTRHTHSFAHHRYHHHLSLSQTKQLPLIMRGGNPSLRQTRHVLRLMGRRMTSVYGSTVLMLCDDVTLSSANQCAAGTHHHHRRRFLSGSGGDVHNQSTLILTSKTKDGSGGNDNNNNNTTTPSADKDASANTSSTTSTCTSTTADSNLRDIPRRIVVKKSSSSTEDASGKGGTDSSGSSSGSGSNRHIKQQQRVGYLKRRFPLHNESKLMLLTVNSLSMLSFNGKSRELESHPLTLFAICLFLFFISSGHQQQNNLDPCETNCRWRYSW